MSRPIYTAVAAVSGGRRHGHGRSADGELDVQLRVSTERGNIGVTPVAHGETVD
jgi:lipoyl-dependent peroxiredoxin